MYQQIDSLIEAILEQYEIFSNQWKKKYKNDLINMRKITVRDIGDKSEILEKVESYRNFLIQNAISLQIKAYIVEKLNISQDILFVRIKNYNSLQDKIERYNFSKNHDYGRIQLNKCLNDLLGIRIIIDDEFSYNELQHYIDKKYNNVRCILSKKGNYIAVHVYFGIDDNTNYRWELQIWNKKDAKKNEESHRDYKQNYKVWEENYQKEG